MKKAFYLIIGLICILTLLGCEKEESLPPFNGTCTGNIIMIPDSDTYCLTSYVDTFYIDLLDTFYVSYYEKMLYLDTFHIKISGSCKLTFEDDNYYLVFNVIIEHYNMHNKALLWDKFMIFDEKGTFDYSYGENDYAYYVKSITFYPENKEQYRASFYRTGFWALTHTHFSIPYLVSIEDSMKFCTEYEYDTLSSQFVCIKDTILNIHEFEIKLWFSSNCLKFTK